ncbi:MAG: membrane protein insertase YidC [Thermodesulfovibrionales bacterium]|nr:membrane protein insertase YidC [Thermodesulfovibrionales bacterium]
MDRNVFLAIIISIAILIVYQYYTMHTATPPKTTQKQDKEVAKDQPKENINYPSSLPSQYGIDKTTKNIEKEIIIENNLYTAVFTTRGASIKTITFKNYKDKSGNFITLRGDETLSPLALGIDENFQFSNLIFNSTSSNIKLDGSNPTASLVFEYSSPEISIRRTFTFTNNDYSFILKDEVKGINNYWITIGKDFGIYEKEDSVHHGPVVLKDADRIEFTSADLVKSGAKSYNQGLKWIAQEDKYFFSSIVPKTPIIDSKVWSSHGNAIVALKMPEGSNEYFIYSGPKEYDRLKKYGVGLEHIIDFGLFSILAIPLFWVMKFFYNIFHNYGLAIIMLTILTRIPFIPIINRGMTSMKKVQEIQPKMLEIREKYKKDPQKMNQELMALYKKHKVNPFGGCLPILLQIPVFFALFKILSISIELRGAPFMLWITDLSSKDPYYILPIIMGVTMVIQQKMTPSTMDPKQQKLMMLLPIIFTFLFFTFPSGLVLYWLVNNILGIAQQFYMNRKAAKSESA